MAMRGTSGVLLAFCVLIGHYSSGSGLEKVH